MRFMIIVKATPESEAGVMPTPQQLAEMGAFNESLAAWTRRWSALAAPGSPGASPVSVPRAPFATGCSRAAAPAREAGRRQQVEWFSCLQLDATS